MRYIIFLFFILGTVNTSWAQLDEEQVKWSTSVEQIGTQLMLVSTAEIGEGWHMYAQKLDSDEGPIPTSFTFETSNNYQLVGKVKEGKAISEYDSNFEMQVRYFEKEATFKQVISLMGSKSFIIKGTVEYMICNEHMCLPPTSVDITFEVNPASK